MLLLTFVVGLSLAGDVWGATNNWIDFDEWWHHRLMGNQTGRSQNLTDGGDETGWVRDLVWESMVTTAWQDYITTLNRDKELYGVLVEPLELALVTGMQGINLDKEILGYQVKLSLTNLSLHGLSGLVLETLSLSRDSSLSSIFTEAVLDAPHLLLTGSYTMEAQPQPGLLSYLLPHISSEGEQSFFINITTVRIRCDLKVEMVSGCDADEEGLGAVATAIKFPFSYTDIDFQFNNMGTVLGAAMDILGGQIIQYQRRILVDQIKLLIESEVPSLVCESYYRSEGETQYIDTGNRNSPVYKDQSFKSLLSQEQDGQLIRDRLAENVVSKILNESVLRHLQTYGSPLQTQLDPLKLFPIEFAFSKDVYQANVEACNAYVHNVKTVQLDSMYLARDPTLAYSAFRIQFRLPITWVTGYYKLRNAYLFTFIPAGGSGDFNVNLKDVTVSLAVILRRTQEGELEMEHFKVNIDWHDLEFKFDGLWSGLEEIADKVMNQLGLAGVIVAKQKLYIMDEIKTYLRGLAVCMMWSPSQGIELCMREFWIGLGWEWPWVYPTCDL